MSRAPSPKGSMLSSQLIRRQAASQVGVHTCRGLISILLGLGEQFHDDRRDGCWYTRSLFGGRHSLTGNMAMHQVHGIRGCKGQPAGD